MDNILLEKSILSENGRTFYWTAQTNKEVTLVFLPGLTANHILFEKQILYFYDKYNILVWDCPCHGKSRPYKNFNYLNISRELNTILEAEGSEKVVIIGQSLGGMIGQYYIDAYPSRVLGFVSIDSSPFGDYYKKSDFFWLSQLEWMCRLFPENKEIKLPCTAILILGDGDCVGKVATYNKKWANKTGYPLNIIKNAAHNSNDDRPEEVNQIIENYVQSIEAVRI